MDEKIDFQLRSRKYRAKYLENLGQLCGKANDAKISQLGLPGKSISKRKPSPTGSKKNAATHKFKPKEKVRQIALYHWRRHEMGLFCFAIPNGSKRSIWGHSQEIAMGLYPGASDLYLSVASGGYNGYYIEMKRKGEKPKANQLEFMAEARKNGYKAEWFDDWLIAQASVIEYLGLTKPAA